MAAILTCPNTGVARAEDGLEQRRQHIKINKLRATHTNINTTPQPTQPEAALRTLECNEVWS